MPHYSSVSLSFFLFFFVLFLLFSCARFPEHSLRPFGIGILTLAVVSELLAIVLSAHCLFGTCAEKKRSLLVVVDIEMGRHGAKMRRMVAKGGRAEHTVTNHRIKDKSKGYGGKGKSTVARLGGGKVLEQRQRKKRSRRTEGLNVCAVQ